jgi:Tol biopolymer transport system component
MDEHWRVQLEKLKAARPPRGLWEKIRTREPAPVRPIDRRNYAVVVASAIVALTGVAVAGIAFLRGEGQPVRHGASSETDPENGLIAYVSGPGASRIVGADPATGRSQYLTTPGPREFDSDPAWSAVGNRLAFVRTEPGLENVNLSQSLCVLDLFDSLVNKVPLGDISPLAPRWSPDGAWLAFEGTVSEGTGVYIVRPDGSGLTALPSRSGHALHPAWAPDSSRVIYVDGNEVIISNTKNMAVEHRFPHDEITFSPAWSPDGSQVAYLSGRQIHIRPISDSSSGAVFDPDLSSVAQLRWSPDGDSLTFSGLADGNWNIYSLDLSGGRIESLTEGKGDESFPIWAPDGSLVAYLESPIPSSQGDNTGTFDLFLMTSSGGQSEALTTTGTVLGSSLDWQPTET